MCLHCKSSEWWSRESICIHTWDSEKSHSIPMKLVTFLKVWIHETGRKSCYTWSFNFNVSLFLFFLTNKQPPKLFLKSIEMLRKDLLNPYELKKLTFVSSFHPPGKAEKWRFGHRVCISKSRHKLWFLQFLFYSKLNTKKATDRIIMPSKFTHSVIKIVCLLKENSAVKLNFDLLYLSAIIFYLGLL